MIVFETLEFVTPVQTTGPTVCCFTSCIVIRGLIESLFPFSPSTTMGSGGRETTAPGSEPWNHAKCTVVGHNILVNGGWGWNETHLESQLLASNVQPIQYTWCCNTTGFPVPVHDWDNLETRLRARKSGSYALRYRRSSAQTCTM